MTGQVDSRKDLIGLNTWWKQSNGKVFVVIRFLGFEVAEIVEILPLYSNSPREIQIQKFIEFIDNNKIERIPLKNEP